VPEIVPAGGNYTVGQKRRTQQGRVRSDPPLALS